MSAQSSATSILNAETERLFDELFRPINNVERNKQMVSVFNGNPEFRQQLFLWTYKRLKALNFFNASRTNGACQEGFAYLNAFGINKDAMTTRYEDEEVDTPVLLYIRSDTCPHCKYFDTIWSNDKSLETVTRFAPGRFNVRVRTLSVPNAAGWDLSFPVSLRRFNKWFPMLVLLPGKEWNLAKSQPFNPVFFGNHNTVEVYNGRFDANGGLRYLHEYMPSSTNVNTWLDNAVIRQSYGASQPNMVTFANFGAPGAVGCTGSTGPTGPTGATTASTHQDEEEYDEETYDRDDSDDTEDVVFSGRNVVGILTDIRDDFNELIELLRKKPS